MAYILLLLDILETVHLYVYPGVCVCVLCL